MIELTEGITPENLHAIYSSPKNARVGNDGQAMYPVFHPLALYLSAWVNGVFSGAYLTIRYSDFEYEVHSLLSRRAVMQSRNFGRLLLGWVFSHYPVTRCTGYIAEGIESARNHCLNMGFKQEGFRRDAIMVNGKPKGLYVMGITRSEWCAL